MAPDKSSRLVYLFTHLAEEASEVSKEANKCIRFGLHDRFPAQTSPDNLQRLRAELRDLVAVVEVIEEERAFLQSLMPTSAEDVERKKQQVRLCLRESEVKGLA